ncbi:unnamed protein product [Spirodela intermedia]|uniref:DNA/RNA-binding protein Alba-like domain-containing protein n=1 Tax=Spirodela intermedia TaxID=51605 RepID=A0A7I8JB62_SPIIN|nr:unnamed protein product [Spirodela intermedia]CAA6666712.1 unnamed protein product [Spirodela intermedia]
MDRYQRVEKPREEAPINENEIRVTTQGRMRNYISYAINLFQEKGTNEIVLKAMGRAINKSVMIVELIKRRIAGLHQITVIGSTDITDTWEPLEEGLLPIETTRHVSLITITLTKEALDTSSVPASLPSDQVKPLPDFDDEGEDLPYNRNRGRGGRTRGRGRGNPNAADDYPEGGWSNGDHGYGRGGGYGGRGRGRGFRGQGRGGYGGRGYFHHENGEDHEAANVPPQGRGRGRGRGGRGRGREFRSSEPSGSEPQA